MPNKLKNTDISSIALCKKGKQQYSSILIKKSEDDGGNGMQEKFKQIVNTLAEMFGISKEEVIEEAEPMEDPTPEEVEQEVGTTFEEELKELQNRHGMLDIYCAISALMTTFDEIIESEAENKDELLSGALESFYAEAESILPSLKSVDIEGEMSKENKRKMKNVHMKMKDVLNKFKDNEDEEPIQEQPTEELTKSEDIQTPEKIALAKAMEEKAELESKIAKMEDERITMEFIKKCESLDYVIAEPQTMAKIFKSMSTEDFNEVEKILKQANQIIKTSKVFEEFGTSQSYYAADESTEAWLQIEQLASDLVMKDSTYTKQKAIDIVLQTPKGMELYNIYKNKKNI